MIAGFLALLGCQLAGKFFTELLHLPVPGPVIGMVILLILLLIRRPAPAAAVVRTAEGLLTYLPLLFIPAGVGLIDYLRVIGAQWLPILAGLTLSWLLALIVTAAIGTGALTLQTRHSNTTPGPQHHDPTPPAAGIVTAAAAGNEPA